jgi:pimeloyl-ACP methyl ester carboxylesterase
MPIGSEPSDTIGSMFVRNCTWAFLLVLVAAAAQAQEPSGPPSRGYTIFLRGTPIGREDVSVRTDASGTSIASQGRMSVPSSITTRRVEVKYGPDWTPLSFALDATVNGGDVTATSTFTENVARTNGTQTGSPYSREHAISPQTVVLLPSSFFGAFEAVSRRFVNAPQGTELRAYVVPQTVTSVKLLASVSERIQVGKDFFDVVHFEAVWQIPGTGDLGLSITAMKDGSLVRFTVPSQGLDVIRADVAASTSRTQVFSNPGDEAVLIPALGFNIGATVTRPATAAAGTRLPAVILLAGAGINDRDGTAHGVPTLGQLAGAMAKAGYLVVRYDKRGFGQSGGRAESATLGDYADDARAVVRWLLERKDVDPKRIALVGHSEGAWVALLAAAREKRVAAVAFTEAASSTGADLALEQQRYELDHLQLTPDEREKKVALQKQIQTAVMTGKGWEGISANERKAADTPWLQSFLTFDPAKAIEDLRQPLLILHGALDKEVPVAHADRLADLARKSDSKSVEVVTVRGVNHLLVPATTGEISEYGSLPDRTVSRQVTSAVAEWLARTLPAKR